jgi:hypothetical protein
MLRKVALVGSVIALAVAALGVGTAEAAKPKVNASGSLNCPVTGKAKINPPLVFGGTGPVSFVLKLKSGTCTGSSGVTAFKGTLTATLPTRDCLGLAPPAPFAAASISQKVKLKGNQKFNPTAISFTQGGTFTVTNPITLSVPGNGTSSATGSFAGQNPSLFLVADQGVDTFAANCQPKTKGVKGSGGLKKMSFSGASALTIPA